MTNIDWAALPVWPHTNAEPATTKQQSLDDDGLHRSRARCLQLRLTSVQADEHTTVHFLAQADHLVMPKGIDRSITWKQDGDDLVITAWYCHRQYNDWFWNLPMVFEIRHPATPRDSI